MSPKKLWALAVSLSLASAVSLGITRFAYGLLLPAMREDLGWSYTVAGSMNTANAAGYLLGAVATPWLLRRMDAGTLLWTGALCASLFMGLSGMFTTAEPLLMQRTLAGVASAFVFISGGLMAARLCIHAPRHSGVLIGMYYGGTGLGIVLSAVMVPWLLEHAHAQQHGWRWAWWVMALVCLLASVALIWPAKIMKEAPPIAVPNSEARIRWKPFAPALLAYTLFGMGYIGYMTFVVALLRGQGTSPQAVTVFYAMLGLAVIASSWIWAGLLQRNKNGDSMALLNVLLAIATVLPALTQTWAIVMFSGVLFGGVFLSVVASTTALVRHNLPQHAWAAGISAFTIAFAVGQITGPTMVGWIADSSGGLERGLVVSACALLLGAMLAWQQKALDPDDSNRPKFD